METLLKITRHFLAWGEPGGEELGRVELRGVSNLNEPAPHQARLVETVTIPAGAVVAYVVEENDPLS